MHQLLLLAYFLSGQHIEYVVRNTIRYSKPGTEARAVIQVRDHEHDVPAEHLDTVFYLPSCDCFQRRDGGGAGLGLAIKDRCTEVE
jgi:signal transduction histidine kinase